MRYDALPPDVLAQLIEDALRHRIDFDLWKATKATEQEEKEALFTAVTDFEAKGL